MSDEAITKPTLETVLERINDLRGEIVSLRTEFNTFRDEQNDFREELHTLHEELNTFRTEQNAFREKVEVSFDRIESMTNLTRHEMLNLRMDFREIRAQFKQPT